MQKPCPACGSGKFPGFGELAEIAAQAPLSPSLAASRETREKRLEICKTCDALRETVLCAHCGCFVVFRSRPAQSFCPHPAGDYWNDLGTIKMTSV